MRARASPLQVTLYLPAYRIACAAYVCLRALHLLDQDALSYRSKIRVLIIYRACAQVVQWASQHCIKDKVSFWGSETLKIVIPVENHPQRPEIRLADYHPLWGWGGVLISGQIYLLTIYVHIW